MEPFIGQIMMVGFNFAPRGWALCDGQLLAISSNQALFSLIGTTYGGDGRTTFALPDLRGRVPMHAGSGPGLSPRRLGENFGMQSNTLTVSQLPSHGHPIKIPAKAEGDTDNPAGNVIAGHGTNAYGSLGNTSPDANLKAFNTENAGGSVPINNIQPSLVLNYCIALQGIFPSRN